MAASSLQSYPPPGKLLTVAGHQMHILSTGKGTPTVVLEAGGAGWSLDWHFVQEKVASFTRVCSYDRAGFGWSEPGPKPRHAVAMAEELKTLLRASQLQGPYDLVGASFGGHISRIIAATNRHDVEGLVLLDARHEDLSLPPSWKRLERYAAVAQRVMLFLSRAHLLSLAARMGGSGSLPPGVKKLPPEVRDAYLAVGFQPKYFEANLAELESIAESDAQVRAAARPSDIPLVVIRHGIPDLFAALPPADIAEAEITWQKRQEDLVALSDNSRLVVAEQSGHSIQYDQPDLVVDIIREMVTRSSAAG
jgi:pimeloyl-ACP methyl ester carboxylesterase